MRTPTLFEYLPFEAAVAITKLAEAKPIVSPKTHMVKTVAQGLAGLGVGTFAGYGLGEVMNRVYKGVEGKNIPHGALLPAASVLGGAMGLAYSLYKAKEQQELARAFEAIQKRAPK